MKQTLLSAFLFFAVIASQAQVTVKPGIRAGANFSKITSTDFDYRPAFYVGGFVAVKLTRFYTLQPEINYSSQGAKANVVYLIANQNYYAEQNISIGYLSFAMINRFTFSDQFDLHFGPTLDFQTDSNTYTNSDVDLAFTAGVGYTLPFGLTIEARVKKGIVDVLESDSYNESYNYVDDWNTNLVFQVGASYKFDVKGATK